MSLREVRKERGVSQVACARKLKMSRATYLKYEKESWRFNMEQAYILKNYLNCSYDDIFLPTNAN